jgi:hypothetical protein
VLALAPDGRAGDNGTVLVGRGVSSADIAATGSGFLVVYAAEGHVHAMPVVPGPSPRRRAAR